MNSLIKIETILEYRLLLNVYRAIVYLSLFLKLKTTKTNARSTIESYLLLRNFTRKQNKSK